MQLFEFTLGDWKHHNTASSETFLIQANCSLSEVQALYIKTCQLRNISFDSSINGIPSLCNKYLEGSVNIKDFEKLGLNPDNYSKGFTMKDWAPEEFVQLWMDFLMIHNPGLTLMITESQIPNFRDNQAFSLFGYGLFEY